MGRSLYIRLFLRRGEFVLLGRKEVGFHLSKLPGFEHVGVFAFVDAVPF